MDAIERLNAWVSGGENRTWSITLWADGLYYVRLRRGDLEEDRYADTADKDLLVAVEAAISEMEGRDGS